MTAPRIVSPQEAREDFANLVSVVYSSSGMDHDEVLRYAHTVATEPDRIRAAVIRELDNLATIGAGADFEHIVRSRADAFRRGERSL